MSEGTFSHVGAHVFNKYISLLFRVIYGYLKAQLSPDDKNYLCIFLFSLLLTAFDFWTFIDIVVIIAMMYDNNSLLMSLIR